MANPFCPEWENPGRVHLIGVGGIGMAGLARLLHQSGFKVSGSDHAPNRLTRELEDLGISFFEGHHSKNLPPDVRWAIRTPAVGEGNPEVDALRYLGIPVRVRGEVLAAYTRKRKTLAVAGAHGKTTTSSMLAHVLRSAGLDAGYAIGGETTLPGRVSDIGTDPVFACEADESDGTLVYYAPHVALLTHIEWDHVERFRSEAALLTCYKEFVSQSKRVWIREDDVLAAEVCKEHKNVKKVGRSEGADLRLISAVNDPLGQQIKGCFEDTHFKVRLSLPGLHNAWNGLMAIAAAMEVGISLSEAATGLESFGGVARRFQKLEKNGILLIQDYAHHPTEIRAVMESVKALNPVNVWVVFQPHRFSRTRHLLKEFANSFEGADHLALLPVYAASEVPGQGSGSEVLADQCRGGFPRVKVFGNRAELVKDWAPQFQEGDVLLILGAGDIEALQGELMGFL